ncbi:hypothetical protein E3Q22_01358 [Wallemia mellicola]|uniref:ERCC4 domain-containing protein n=1 Tax=Wallemia mellicola TaxID=1708541 RepID=A0A4T0MDE3_9BASI|nr:hypothetical protein E3Q22_01358 [Wallemia mellicola]TIC17466.1 hypothetical protein E3Q15_00622 [Wallemia mellicola]
MELPLRFHRQILRQLIPQGIGESTEDDDNTVEDLDPSDSGLLILGPGLGLRKIVASFLALQSDPRRLVLIINADPQEEDGIGDLLSLMGVARPGLRVVNFDIGSSQREELYKGGGLVVTPDSTEAFITNIYRDNNKDGFLKAFSDDPVQFNTGVTPLQTVLRSLKIRKVWIWPRFHETVQQDLEKRKADVVELYPSMTKIQEIKKSNVSYLDIDDFTVDNALFKSFDKIIRMQLLPVWHLIRPKTKGMIEDLRTLRNLLTYLLNYSCVELQEFLESIYQSNLEDYKNSSMANKTPSPWLYLDAADTIFNTAKGRTYKVVDGDSNKNKHRSWLPPNIVPILEEQPKWSVLTEVLAEIDNNIHFNSTNKSKDERNMTLIMCASNKVAIQLSEYLDQCEDDNNKLQTSKRAPKMMKRLLRDHLEMFKANIINMSTNMKSDVQQPNVSNKANNPTNSEQEMSAALQRKEQFRRNEGATAYGHNRRRVRGGSVMASVASNRKSYNTIDPNTVSPLEAEARQIAQFKSQRSTQKNKEKEVIEISDDSDDEDERLFDNTPQFLLTGDPNDVFYNDEYFGLMEEDETILIRAYRDDDDDTLLNEIRPKYIIMYDPNAAFVRRVELYKSSNPQIDIRMYFLMYNASVEEQTYLSGLRKEKDAFERLIREKSTMLMPLLEKESSRAGTDHYLSALSARVAGGQVITGDTKPKIIVDNREFRSSLPGILYRSKFEVIPVTLTVGDYVLDPTILFTQCEYMSTYYKTPILLIEFEENKSFTLETISESKKVIPHMNTKKPSITGTSPTEIFQSRLVMLTISFPRLRILWSSSPRQTAEMFADLKYQREEPDRDKAVSIGQDEVGQQDLIEENWSTVPSEISFGLLLSFSQPSQYTSRIFRGKNNGSYHRRPLTSTWLRPDLETKERQKAAFVVLARNSDLYQFLPSMRAVEDRFNKKFGYEWVFLNDKTFSDEFKKRTQALSDSPCHYGLIPEDHWNQPSFINETKASEARDALESLGKVPYANSVPYRNMCRFNSGFFWRHPLLDNFDYYWRVEPDIKLFCDVDYDPFQFLAENDINYGFTVSLYEYQESIPTLWETVKNFIHDHPEHVPKENAMKFLSDDGGKTYNHCHFWSNFEIANLNLWRSPAYRAFFDYLDKAGGFYYERWGDAPVHSIAAALFSRPDQIHFFEDIGYRHEPFQHCPQGDAAVGRCYCDPGDNFDTPYLSTAMSARTPLTPVKHRATGSGVGLPFGFSTPMKQPSTPAGHSPAYLTVSKLSISETKIVIDPGSKVIKVGFSGEASPRECIMIREILWDLDGIQDELGVLDIFRDIYFEQLQTDPKQRRVIIAENPLLSSPVKFAIMSVLFSNLQVPSVSFTPSPLLSLISAGRTTGLVVDIGYLQTVVSPVYASRPLDPHIMTTSFGGKYLSDRLRELIVEYATYYPPFTTQQLSTATSQPPPSTIPQDAITDAWIEDVKCKALFAEPLLRKREDDDEVMSESDDDASQISVKLQTNNGRGVVFIPGWIRSKVVEDLFDSKEDIDQPSIPECIVKCLQKLPIDTRRDLAANCLVVGGTASMVGFRTRLKNEIRELLTRSSETKKSLMDLSGLSASFEVLNDPIPSQASQPTDETTNRRKSNKVNMKAPAWNPSCYAWVGASLSGSVKLSAPEIQRNEFEESIEDKEIN